MSFAVGVHARHTALYGSFLPHNTMAPLNCSVFDGYLGQLMSTSDQCVDIRPNCAENEAAGDNFCKHGLEGLVFHRLSEHVAM